MNPHEGTTLGSRYTLTDRIASGGMGDVWRASDAVLGRDVAVKVMRPNASDDSTFAERFRDEARHTASLSHPNIAQVYDYGEDDGAAYLVMELVEGQPLSQVIARGPVPAARTRAIVGQAALALAAAHAGGVVHRDVKPANILVTPEGRVKLTDFGIARATDSAGHTRTGEVLGTPHYLSPEQALGRGATGASDIYALGVVAHEMLTGLKPFDSGTAVATALSQVNDPPPDLPATVPADLRRIVASCLAKDPAARPASAASLAASLGMPVSGLHDAPAATGVIQTAHTDPSATQVVLPEAPPLAGATAILPTATPPPHAPAPPFGLGSPPPEPRRRSGAGWWWLPVLVALAAIGFFAWQYATTSGGLPLPDVTRTVTTTPTSSTPVPPPTTITPTRTTATPTPTTPPPTTPPPTTQPPSTTSRTQPPSAAIVVKDYIGKPAGDAESALRALGFQNIAYQNVAGKQPAGTVTQISPTGTIALDRQITLTVSDGSATAGAKDGSTKGKHDNGA